MNEINSAFEHDFHEYDEHSHDHMDHHPDHHPHHATGPSHQSQQTFITLNVDTKHDSDAEERDQRVTPSFDGGSIAQLFTDICFDKVADHFDVHVQYDSSQELLSLELVNKTTKNVFKEDFDKEKIHQITDECKLEPDLVVKMIIDNLSSPKYTKQNMRLFLLPNIKRAMAKYDEIVKAKVIPQSEEVSSGSENDDNDSCLLLILHFSAPPYISFNYGFVIKMMYVTDNDKLAMRVTDLEKDNEDLKQTVNALLQISRTQQAQLSQLLSRFDEENNGLPPFDEENGHEAARFNAMQTTAEQYLQSGRLVSNSIWTDHNETGQDSVEEMSLYLLNGWVIYSGNWSIPKAVKIGHVVYLNGLVKNGANGHIATLPPSWRPQKQKMFSQCTNGNTTRVDVFPDGRVIQQSKFKSFLSLEGISFVVSH